MARCNLCHLSCRGRGRAKEFSDAIRPCTRTESHKGPQRIRPRPRVILHFQAPPCILSSALGAAGTRPPCAVAMFLREDAVPDICCSLSSSPQQGICIIIISPRPSRKLQLTDEGPGYQTSSLHPFLDLLLLEEKRKKERRGMESGGGGEGRGKNELLPLTRRAMTVSYWGKNNLGAGEGQVTGWLSQLYRNTEHDLCIRSPF